MNTEQQIQYLTNCIAQLERDLEEVIARRDECNNIAYRRTLESNVQNYRSMLDDAQAKLDALATDEVEAVINSTSTIEVIAPARAQHIARCMDVVCGGTSVDSKWARYTHRGVAFDYGDLRLTITPDGTGILRIDWRSAVTRQILQSRRAA